MPIRDDISQKELSSLHVLHGVPSETAPLLGHSLSRDGVVFDFAGYLNGLEKVSKARAAELASKWLNPVDRLVCLSGSAEELKTLFPNTYQF